MHDRLFLYNLKASHCLTPSWWYFIIQDILQIWEVFLSDLHILWNLNIKIWSEIVYMYSNRISLIIHAIKSNNACFIEWFANARLHILYNNGKLAISEYLLGGLSAYVSMSMHKNCRSSSFGLIGFTGGRSSWVLIVECAS